MNDEEDEANEDAVYGLVVPVLPLAIEGAGMGVFILSPVLLNPPALLTSPALFILRISRSPKYPASDCCCFPAPPSPPPPP